MKAALVIAALAAVAAGCGGGQSDRSTQIGAEIHGTCTATSYEIIGKLDHSKARIYDCMRNGKRICVTEENGFASDQTQLAKILFQDNLSGGRPGCAKGKAF